MVRTIFFRGEALLEENMLEVGNSQELEERENQGKSRARPYIPLERARWNIGPVQRYSYLFYNFLENWNSIVQNQNILCKTCFMAMPQIYNHRSLEKIVWVIYEDFCFMGIKNLILGGKVSGKMFLHLNFSKVLPLGVVLVFLCWIALSLADEIRVD